MAPFKNVAGIGTHYVRSVKHGGELVASLTFKSEDSSYVQEFNTTILLNSIILLNIIYSLPLVYEQPSMN